MKFGLKEYFKPTPKLMRKIGDTMLAISLVSVPVAMINDKTVGFILIGCGIVGKFLTNWFSEDK
jgi:hypothetical protein